MHAFWCWALRSRKTSPAEVERSYGIQLSEAPSGSYDAIVLAVAHAEYVSLNEEVFLSWTNGKAVFGDIKGIYRHQIHQLEYWSL